MYYFPSLMKRIGSLLLSGQLSQENKGVRGEAYCTVQGMFGETSTTTLKMLSVAELLYTVHNRYSTVQYTKKNSGYGRVLSRVRGARWIHDNTKFALTVSRVASIHRRISKTRMSVGSIPIWGRREALA